MKLTKAQRDKIAVAQQVSKALTAKPDAKKGSKDDSPDLAGLAAGLADRREKVANDSD